MKTTVIFDLDGTLLNTIADLGNACNHALQQNNLIPHPLSAYNQMVGNGIRNLIRNAAPDETDTCRESILRDFLKYYDRHCTDLTLPYPGIPELLSSLRQLDITLAVCSNKYQKAVDKIINFYFPGIRFAAIYGEREGIPRKPSPESVKKIMKELGVTEQETVMVGDSDVDIATAQNAGIDSIAVTWGFRSVPVLKESDPIWMVSNPSEILSIIE